MTLNEKIAHVIPDKNAQKLVFSFLKKELSGVNIYLGEFEIIADNAVLKTVYKIGDGETQTIVTPEMKTNYLDFVVNIEDHTESPMIYFLYSIPAECDTMAMVAKGYLLDPQSGVGRHETWTDIDTVPVLVSKREVWRR